MYLPTNLYRSHPAGSWLYSWFTFSASKFLDIQDGDGFLIRSKSQCKLAICCHRFWNPRPIKKSIFDFYAWWIPSFRSWCSILYTWHKLMSTFLCGWHPPAICWSPIQTLDMWTFNFYIVLPKFEVYWWSAGCLQSCRLDKVKFKWLLVRLYSNVYYEFMIYVSPYIHPLLWQLRPSVQFRGYTAGPACSTSIHRRARGKPRQLGDIVLML